MPDINVEITDKAFELLQEFKEGTGFNDDSQVIIEMFYSLKPLTPMLRVTQRR